MARDYKIPVFSTIDEALCLGTGELAVDAVLLIGEHGNYPMNALGQTRVSAEAVLRRDGRSLCGGPSVSSRSLTTSICRIAGTGPKRCTTRRKELGIPLMAGSSVPLAQRRPALELPPEAEIEEIISVEGGPLESYDFHGLEVLQSLAEGRKGGETGISRVEFLTGDALFKAADEGRWSLALAEAAMAAEAGVRKIPLRELIREPPRAILLHYKDGLKGTVLSASATAPSLERRLPAEKRRQLRGRPISTAARGTIADFSVHWRTRSSSTSSNRKSPYPRRTHAADDRSARRGHALARRHAASRSPRRIWNSATPRSIFGRSAKWAAPGRSSNPIRRNPRG